MRQSRQSQFQPDTGALRAFFFFLAQPAAQYLAGNDDLSRGAVANDSNGSVRVAPTEEKLALRGLHAQGLHAPFFFSRLFVSRR